MESSSALDGEFAAPRETGLCFRPHLDGRTTGETEVPCSESLKHVPLASLSWGSLYYITSPASAQQMRKVTMFLEKIQL